MIVSSSETLYGGAELCLYDFATRVAGQGWTPVVVVPAEGALARALRARDVTVEVLELGTPRNRGELRSPMIALRLLQALAAAVRLRRLVRKHHAGVVHSNSIGVLAGALGARLAGAPHVWHVREILEGPLWRVYRRAVPALSVRVVCISDVVARRFDAGPGRVEVVRDGVDLRIFSPVAGVERNPDQVLMVGRVHPQKGHELFIRAAATVAQAHPAARFEIVGNVLPPYRRLEAELRSLAAGLGLGDRLTWRSHVEREELPALMSAAAVMVVPSGLPPEGGGLVVLEGMACGAAVVATAHGGPTEVIDDEHNGLLVPPQDPTAMARAIAGLLADPERRGRMGGAGQTAVAGRFSIDESVRRLAAVYTAVAAGAKR